MNFGGSLLRNARFADSKCESLRKFVRGSLVRNARFGGLTREFWGKARAKRSFCRLEARVFEEVSCEALLEG